MSEASEIEHTIPRSLCCDNSQENKTVAHRECNRSKKNRIPHDCPDHEKILRRIDHWQDRVDELDKLIEKQKPKSKYAATKEAKDNAIQKRLLLQFERDYLRGKHRRFTMVEVSGGFKNSQLVDTRIITKYARLYLKTVFPAVHTVNGRMTDDFRRCWGVEKSRDNHAHHTVDAIVAACVTREQYDKLAQYYHQYESYEMNDPSVPQKPHFSKPWKTFTEDMKELKNQILVSHYAPNHLLKQTKRYTKVRGKRVIQQGKTARGSLHKDTFYGRIKARGEEKTVVRVPLVYASAGGLFGFKNLADCERIVDQSVREKVMDLIRRRCAQGASFTDALKETVWMNETKGVAIKKARCFVGSVKNPLPLKLHGSPSRYPHKQNYYVQNDTVHVVAVYADEVDVQHAGFSALDAVKNGVNIAESIRYKEKDIGLKYVLHTDQLVIFCKEDASELFDLSSKDISCRLYKVNDLSMAESRMVFRHHMEAREKGKVIEENAEKRGTRYPSSLDFESPNPLQRISYKNMNIAIEGSDFQLNVLGEIEFMGE